MIRRILVGLGDQTYASAATLMAIDIARAQRSSLTGLCILDRERIGATGPVPVGGGSAAADLRAHRIAKAKKIIVEVTKEFGNSATRAAIEHSINNPEGDPYQCMSDAARYHDLIVCGLGHLFEHGVVDEPPAELIRLVQAGVRPLITVSPKHRRINNVLIAYSGSMESAKAMKRFAQLRLWPDANLRVVTFEHSQATARSLLGDAVNYLRSHGFSVDSDYEPSSAKRSLLPYANDWNADLIVMGNSNRNLILRRIFGETMLHTVQHADRPLFLAQ